MIISGYQGIGKSTLSAISDRVIDLESGSFWVDGKRSDDWYKVYCQIAVHLSMQGYIVFVSSHKLVRDELYEKYDNIESICVIYPYINLKEKWIEKLEKRYEETKFDKDLKALEYAKEHYKENIAEIMQGGLSYYEINSTDYKLSEIVEYLSKQYRYNGYNVTTSEDE